MIHRYYVSFQVTQENPPPEEPADIVALLRWLVTDPAERWYSDIEIGHFVEGL